MTSKEKFNLIMDASVGKNALAEEKKELKKTVIVSILGTIILALVCVSTMYIRFKVF